MEQKGILLGKGMEISGDLSARIEGHRFHFVLREQSCFIGADYGDPPELFHGGKPADHNVILLYPPGAHGEGEAGSGGEKIRRSGRPEGKG